MSTSKLDLTLDEQTLHHHVAMFKKDLEAYHSCAPGDETTWRERFRELLVSFQPTFIN
jgi:hypothetical protein